MRQLATQNTPAGTNFSVAVGDLHGLPTDHNHLNVKWNRGDVFFSFTKRGNAISMHFSCLPWERRRIKEAANEFCSFIFGLYPWCEMILAVIGPRSVVKLAEKCGFSTVAERPGVTYMARYRK